MIALAWPQHVHHARAHAWFGSVTGGWATTPITESGFLRLSTNRAVVGETVPMVQVIAVLRAIRSLSGHSFISDASSLDAPAISLERLATSRQVTDAHLVNLAATCDAILATLDRGVVELLIPADREHVLLLP